MKILVTGGAGFIGSNFIWYLHHHYPSWSVVCLDALTYAGNRQNLTGLPEEYTFFQGNICDQDLLTSLLVEEQFDCIIHFAAESHVDRSIHSAQPFLETNVLGTVSLLETLRQFPKIRLIHISTDEVYGSLAKGFAKEEAPLNPSSPYAASKAAAEQFVLAYANTYNLSTNILRATNNYGPRQYPEKLIPLMIHQILFAEKLPLYGDGQNIRNWLYVDDFCRAIVVVLLQGVIGEIYNVSGNQELSNQQVVHTLCQKMNYPETEITYVTDRLGHDYRYGVDATKIESLGWQPQISFKKGIQETINWYRVQLTDEK